MYSIQIFSYQKGILEENRENIRKNLRLIDVWDYEFNRAYGNYYEKICNKEKVPVRKYLYTIKYPYNDFS